MHVRAYIRVSGISQLDGDGERRQREAIEQFCRANGLSAPSIFFEKAVSGTVEGLDRPALAELLEAAQPGDAIVVERLDRLARSLMTQEFILKECRQHKVKVFAADQGTLTDQSGEGADPTRVLVRQILGALAEWERGALVLKLRKARDAKRARGEYCGGNVSYGLQPGEHEILQAMRTLKEAGEGWKQIAEILNLSGHRTRTGRHWKEKNVKAILSGWNLRKHRKEMAT